MKNLIYFLGRLCGNSILYIKIRKNYFQNVFYSGVLSKSFQNSPQNVFIDRTSSFKGSENISIGNNFIGNKGLVIEALQCVGREKFSPSIKIGNNVFMNQNCRIQCVNRIEIGNNVLLAGNIFITDHFHGDTSKFQDIPPAERDLFSKGPVIIEDSVWIGEGAVIMPNVRIGKNSIIGANAVVTKNVEPYSVAAGIPAVIVKKLK